MDLTIVSLIVSGLAILLAVYALFRKPSSTEQVSGSTFESTSMRLQAYERLVLLTERIALPNLISRLNQPGISAVEMKAILLENIKHEFEYNSTQQLYVSPVSWDSVKNLKEQNIMIIHRVGSGLAPGASSMDLNKKILEMLMTQEPLHEMVLQALNFEAKKLMK